MVRYELEDGHLDGSRGPASSLVEDRVESDGKSSLLVEGEGGIGSEGGSAMVLK